MHEPVAGREDVAAGRAADEAGVAPARGLAAPGGDTERAAADVDGLEGSVTSE